MNVIGGLSNEFYRRLSNEFILEGCLMGFLSEVHPMGFKSKNLLF